MIKIKLTMMIILAVTACFVFAEPDFSLFLETCQTDYTINESIEISFYVVNNSNQSQTLIFPTNQIVNYKLGDIFDYSLHSFCLQVITYEYFEPQETRIWTIIFNPDDYPDLELPEGELEIIGKVQPVCLDLQASTFVNIHRNDDTADNLILNIETDSSQYVFGENIEIIITVVNTSAEEILILFPSTCQAYYVIEDVYNYAENYFQTVVTSATVPAGGSYVWSFTHNSSSYPVPTGTHRIVGILENWTIYMECETFIEVSDSADTSEAQALQPYISGVYPNPFNPETKIEFYLPVPTEIIIDIFDSKGRLILRDKESYQRAGYNTWIWNGMGSDNIISGSGVYHARVRIDDTFYYTRMVLLK